MIDGVRIKKLKKIVDERGHLMEMLRDDDDFYLRFGQVYITSCNPGFVKAWHHHEKQNDNFVVVRGKARIGLFDPRENSPTNGKVMDITVTEDDPHLVFIPKQVVHGFEALGDEPCYIVNCVSDHYVYDNPDEQRIDPFTNDIPFKWNGTKGG